MEKTSSFYINISPGALKPSKSGFHYTCVSLCVGVFMGVVWLYSGILNIEHTGLDSQSDLFIINTIYFLKGKKKKNINYKTT